MKIAIVPSGKEHETTNTEWNMFKTDELDKVLAASCEEIRVSDTLDFTENREQILETLCSKLRYKGVITIEGLDLDLISQNVMNGRMNSRYASILMYGGRASISSLFDTAIVLQKLGLKPTLKRYEESRYFITAERPKPNEKQ